ncbi:cation acetate symporter [Streptomyces griseofuscus]|uniref:sodium/solute symporter n=1 Tax=Streptomyces griseofuscus TaxID=146922 RepID=UPI00367F878E
MTALHDLALPSSDHAALSGMAFVAFCGVGALTLMMCVLTGPDSDHPEEFYTGYGSSSPLRGGLAIAGDYISAVTVLGTGGVIALCGYDGVMIAVSTALSLALVMFLFTERLNGTGRFTLGDVLAHRLPGRPARIAVGAVTILALLPMMLVQLADIGRLMAYILGFSSGTAKTGCVVGLGLLIITYSAIGGMQGTALIQSLKTVVLLASGTVTALLVLHRFDWDFGAFLGAAAQHSGVGAAFLRPGLQFGTGGMSRVNLVVSNLTIVLGVACLPHNTMRMYSASGAGRSRRSASWAVSFVTLFMLVMVVVELGATALLGRAAVGAADAQGNTAYLLGSRAALGSSVSTADSVLFMLMTTAILLTVLGSVAGVLLACANSLAHDVFATRDPDLPAAREVKMARWSTLTIGVPTIALATLAQQYSLLPLALLSSCVGASAIAPALLYSLFWRRYTSTGLVATLVAGSVAVLLVAPGTQLISGTPFSVFPHADFAWLPFSTTGIVSIPAGFFFGWLATVRSTPVASGPYERTRSDAPMADRTASRRGAVGHASSFTSVRP